MSPKNLTIRSRRMYLKDHEHQWRNVSDPFEADYWVRGDDPETDPLVPARPPPGTHTGIVPPPPTPSSPDTFAVPEPDRPKTTGTLRELADFEAGMPSGWTQGATGGATIARSAAAALSGSFGLLIQDTTTSSVSTGKFTKVFDAGGGYQMGLARDIRLSVLPSGRLTLGGLARPSDGDLFAWLETGSLSEITTLTIDSSPTDPGNFTVIPEGASAAVAVVATKQVERLSVSTGPSALGTITFTLGGVKFNVPTGGGHAVDSLTVQAPRYTGYVFIDLGGGNSGYVRAYAGETAEALAARIRLENTQNSMFSGWVASGANNVVIFTAKDPGAKPAPVYSPNTSQTPGTMSQPDSGTTEAAAALVDRIAAMAFEGWTISHTPASTTVDFTAVQAGAKGTPSISWGTTGGAGTLTTQTAGAADTPSALAARIRGTAFTGWTLSGSSNQVIFTSNTVGWKRPLRIDPAATGVQYTITPTQRGKSADLTGHVKDDAGNQYVKTLRQSLSTTTIYTVEVAVQGAWTERASINFWLTVGAGQKILAARFEDVSLLNYPAGAVDAGVTAEAVASETWTMHVDNIRVTDAGLEHFDEINPGTRIGQFHHYGLPTQPARDDIGLQDWYEPCIPGQQYAIGAKIRTANVPVSAPAKPVFITAYLENGDAVPIGDVTGDAGISGTHAWTEYSRLVIPPEGAYLLGYSSRNLGAGEIVVQRVVQSLGATVKRTGLYATSGTYTATLAAGTPHQHKDTLWGSARRILRSTTEVPAGSAITVSYKAAATEDALFAAPYQSDPLLVPDRAVLQAQYVFSSGGTLASLPILRSGSPYVAYDLVSMNRVRSVFLREDRSEFEGGAVFADIREWVSPPEVAVTEEPGARLSSQILSAQAPVLPASSLLVFTAETLREIVNNWYKPHVVETDGEALTVTLAAPPTYERIADPYFDDGKKYGVWALDLSWGAITARDPIA